MGPEPPPSRSKRSRPEWVRILEEDAKVDEDVAQVSPIRGADFGENKYSCSSNATVHHRYGMAA